MKKEEKYYLTNDEKNKYKAILEAIDDVVVVLDSKGIVQEINKKLVDLVGYKRDDIIGTYFLDQPFLSDKTKKQMKKNYTLRMKGKDIDPYVIELIHKNGQKKYGKIKANVITNPKTKEKIDVAVMQDITSDYEYRKEIDRERDLLNKHIELSGNIILVLDLDGKIQRINKAGNAILGYKKEELIGENWFEKCLPKDEKKKVKKIFSQLIQGKSNNMIEGAVLTKKEEIKHVRWYNTVIKDDTDKIQYTLSSGIDITEQKEVQEKIGYEKSKYELLFNNSTDALLVINSKGILLEVNKKVIDLAGGYKESDLVGLPIIKLPFLSVKTKAIVMKNFVKRMMGKDIPPYIIEIKGKDGKIRFGMLQARKLIEPITGNVLDFVMVRDVTEEVRAKEELGVLEERYKYIVKNMIDVIYQVDIKGNIKFVTPNCKIYGYTQDELVGKNMLELVHPDDRKEIEKEYIHSLKTDDIFPSVFRLKSKNQGYIEVEEVGKIIKKAGIPIGNIGVIRDISRRKEIETKLVESENRFKEALMDSPFPTLIHAEDGEFILINNAWTKLSGYTKEDLPNLQAWLKKAYGAKRATEVKNDVEFLFKMKKKINHDGEYIIKTKLGKQRVWDFQTSKIGKLPDGRKIVLSMAKDITETIKIKEILEKEKKQNEQILDALPAFIFYKDKKNNFVWVNKEMSDKMGKKKDELIGHNKVEFWNKNEAQKLYQDDLLVIKTGKAIEQKKEKIKTVDGDRLYETTKRPYYSQDGEVIGVVGFSVDVTEKQKTMEKITKTANKLEKINKLMVGRELQMVQLKKKLKELEVKLSKQN